MKERTIQFIITWNYKESNNNNIHLNKLCVFLNERYSMLSKQISFNKNKLINNLKYLIDRYIHIYLI
jgi:hypothetical protein